MGANIELWKYRLYKNSTFHLEEEFQRSYSVASVLSKEEKNPVMVAAGKKAAVTRATQTYTFEEHLEGRPEVIKSLVLAIQDFIMGLDPAMEEAPKKLYVAYKISQNIVCVEIQKRKVVLFLKLDPKQLSTLPKKARDVSNIGHFGTGDLEITIENDADLQQAKPYIEMAYQKIGG